MEWVTQYTVGMQYTLGTQYAVGMQYAVGVSAKRSTHTVYIANIGWWGPLPLVHRKVKRMQWGT